LQKPKSYYISLAGKRYHYTRTQLFNLSLQAIEHFESLRDDFVIENYLNFNSLVQFSQNDLVSCFKELHSLFEATTEILLTPQNQQNFQILADALGNSYLSFQCNQVSTEENRIFKLTSEYLSILKPDQRSKLNNFDLIINEQTITINIELFCCISDLFIQKKDIGN
jgi:seryl-tRNA synthetase